jgi:catechol 2,3-dioxygenase-like lactoylglutathione lyase family enzyme
MPTRTIASGLFAAALFAQIPAPNKEGVAMGHLHLLVRDPAAHRAIWVDVLGARPLKKGNVEFLLLPDVVLAFRKGEPSGGTDDSIVNHLGFQVTDVAATKAKLTAAGLKVVREMPDTKQMFVMFPDGVKVEFSQIAGLQVPIAHHHIHFFTPKVEEMRAWYARHFGAIPGKRLRFEAADLPGVNLSFSPTETPVVGSKGRGVDHIGFEIKNLAEFCKKLEAAGVKFDVPYRDVPQLGLKIAFLTDPWGTYVELTEGLDAYK